MPTESIRPSGEPQEAVLSPTLQQIANMPLHYDDEEKYKQLAFSTNTAGALEVSEDTVLKALKSIITGKVPVGNIVGVILRTLDRESMQASSHKDLFRSALNELADKAGYKIRE